MCYFRHAVPMEGSLDGQEAQGVILKAGRRQMDSYCVYFYVGISLILIFFLCFIPFFINKINFYKQEPSTDHNHTERACATNSTYKTILVASAGEDMPHIYDIVVIKCFERHP